MGYRALWAGERVCTVKGLVLRDLCRPILRSHDWSVTTGTTRACLPARNLTSAPISEDCAELNICF